MHQENEGMHGSTWKVKYCMLGCIARYDIRRCILFSNTNGYIHI